MQGSFAAAAREAEVARHRPQAVAVAADPILAPCTSIAAMRQGRSARCDPSRRLDPARRGAGRRIDGVIEVLGDDDEAREVHDEVETILIVQGGRHVTRPRSPGRACRRRRRRPGRPPRAGATIASEAPGGEAQVAPRPSRGLRRRREPRRRAGEDAPPAGRRAPPLGHRRGTVRPRGSDCLHASVLRSGQAGRAPRGTPGQAMGAEGRSAPGGRCRRSGRRYGGRGR